MAHDISFGEGETETTSAENPTGMGTWGRTSVLKHQRDIRVSEGGKKEVNSENVSRLSYVGIYRVIMMNEKFGRWGRCNHVDAIISAQALMKNSDSMTEDGWAI